MKAEAAEIKARKVAEQQRLRRERDGKERAMRDRDKMAHKLEKFRRVCVGL